MKDVVIVKDKIYQFTNSHDINNDKAHVLLSYNKYKAWQNILKGNFVSRFKFSKTAILSCNILGTPVLNRKDRF